MPSNLTRDILNSYKPSDKKDTTTKPVSNISTKSGATTRSILDSYKPKAVENDSVSKAVSDVQKEVGSVAKPKEGLFSRYMGFSGKVNNFLDKTYGALIREAGDVFGGEWYKGIQNIKEDGITGFVKDNAKGATKEIGAGIKNVGVGFYDFFTKQAPKSITTGLSLASDNLPVGSFGIGVPGGRVIGPNKETMGKAADFFDDVTKYIENQQIERQGELGITDDMSILEPRKFGSVLGSGLGSIASSIAVGAVTKSTWIAGSVLGWIEGSDTYNEAREKLAIDNPEMSEEEINKRSAATALIDSAGIAVLEKVGLDLLFRNYGGGALTNRLINSITETGQETTQSVWSYFVSKYGYNNESDLVKELIEVMVTTPFLGMFGGGGADLVTDVQIVDDISKKMNMEKEDTAKLLETTAPLIDEYIETEVKTGRTFEKEKQTEEVLKEDIRESVETNGEDEVKEELQKQLDIEEKQAQDMIDSAMRAFTGDDQIMKDMEAAERAVKSGKNLEEVEETKNIPETKAKTEEKKETQLEETKNKVEDFDEDIPQELEQEAQIDWEDNFAEKYGDNEVEISKIDESIKNLKPSKDKEKIEKLNNKKEKLLAEQKEAVDTFVDKYQEKAKELKKEKKKKAIKEVQTEVETAEMEIKTPRDGAKRLIRNYVLRGDDFQSLKSGQLGEYSSDIKAQIGGYTRGVKNKPDEIAVEAINDKELDEVQRFKLKDIMAEIKKEAGIEDEKVDKTKKEADNKDNDKQPDKDSKRDVQRGSDTGSRKTVQRKSDKDGRDDKGDDKGGQLEREGSSASSRERSQQDVIESQKERQKSSGYSNEDIENVISDKTEIDTKTGEVKLTKEISEEDLDIVSAYVPAGGREKKGAEGRGLLDEYFTPMSVVDMTADVLGRIGVFKDGMSILEPSVGVGNFIYAGPNLDEADLTGMEVNDVTARIAKINHPKAKIFNKPFEEIFIDSRGNKKTLRFQQKYDLIIGNPPYGDQRGKYKGLGEKPEIKKYEDYFITRSLDLLNKDGYVAMVVPSSFLRTGESNAKIEIATKGVLVDAFRLPNGAFDTTDIGTDLLVFRKRDSDKETTDVASLVDDSYFKANPNRVLGITKKRKNQFGKMADYVEGDLETAMSIYYRNKYDSFSNQFNTTEEQKEDIEEELQSAYKDDVYKETHQPHKIEAKQNTPITKVLADIVEMTGNDINDPELSVKVERENYETLYIERTSENELAMAQYYTQNGDVMVDPEVVFTVGDKGQLTPLTIETAPFGVQAIGPKDPFLRTWAKNLKEQGFTKEETKAKTKKTENTFTKKQVEDVILEESLISDLWGREIPAELFGNKYKVGKMSYGEYYLEPFEASKGRGEQDDFSKGTIWLEKIPKTDTYKINQTLSDIEIVESESQETKADKIKVLQPNNEPNTTFFRLPEADYKLSIFTDGYNVEEGVYVDAGESGYIWETKGNLFLEVDEKISRTDKKRKEIKEEVLNKLNETIGPETTKADKKTSKKNEKVIYKSQKKEKGLLELEQFTEVDKEDQGLWENITATGELEGNYDKSKAYYLGGKYYNKFNYLQGNVYDKLDQLEEDKEYISDDQYNKQKSELEAIIPERMTVDRINISPNTRFVNELKIEGDKTLASMFKEWVQKLPREALGKSSYWAIKGYVDGQAVRGGDKLQNEEERKTRRTEGDRLFRLFISENLSDEAKNTLEETYNRQFNGYAKPDYSKVPLTGKLHNSFNGEKLEIRPVQFQGVGFLVNRGVGLLGHDVGVGKTMQAIIANNELISRGWAKKPLIVVPNISVYNQWRKEIEELIPDVKINLLANLGGDFDGDLATLEIEEGTLSIVTYDGFKKLGFKDETYTDLTKDFFDVIQDPNAKTKRAKENQSAKAEEQIGKGIKGTKTERFFEDLGFDSITMDEAHNANHIIGNAKADDGKATEFRGFNTRPSSLGIKTWLASQYILRENNNRNVFLLSATPFTNNPLEYYSVLSLMARERMERMGIRNVNDFMTMFMDIQNQYEFKANGTYVEKSEVRAFKNYQQFSRLLTEFIDFRDSSEGGAVRPDRVPKEYIVGETKKGFDYKTKAQQLFNDKEGGTLKAIGELRAIAFSPFLSRYSDDTPTYKQFVEETPKIKLTAELIRQNLQDNPDGGQLIYSTIGVEYFPMIRDYLIKEVGLKESEVEIISGKTPKSKRSGIQERFNKGQVKVVIGSDAIKEGVNLQKRTTDMYILSLPWNFTDLRQVIGRAWRPGNKWKKVRINNMFTENSVDIFQSQKLQNKEQRYRESLQFQGDTLDVGDIDFEELKFDLLTDPVARVELETKFDQQKLENDIQRLKSDVAYKNRRADELVTAMNQVAKYEELAKENPDNSWWKDSVKTAKEKLAEVRQRLSEKGLNVDDISKEIEDTNAEIDTIKDKIEKLNKEKEQKLKQAQKERENMLNTSRETNYEAYVNERAEENLDFYQVAQFERRGPDNSDVMPWWVEIEDELTEREKDALFIGFTYSDRVKNDHIPYIQNAYRKYLKKQENKPNFERILSTKILDRVKNDTIVSSQFIEDLTKQKDIKQVERDIVLDVLKDIAPNGGPINTNLFIEKMSAQLLELKVADFTGIDDSVNLIKYIDVNLPADEIGGFEQYDEEIYTSPFKNTAGEVHYDHIGIDNYFAHVRSDYKEKGKIKRILELQSDLFQKGRLNQQTTDFVVNWKGKEVRVVRNNSASFEDFKGSDLKRDGKMWFQSTKTGGVGIYEPTGLENPINISAEEYKKEILPQLKEKSKEAEKMASFRNTWWERIIREEIKRSAKAGDEILRFPLGATAMKIEGLGEQGYWTIRVQENTSANRFINNSTQRRLEIEDLKVGQEVMDSQADKWVVTEVLEDGKFKAIARDTLQYERESGMFINQNITDERMINEMIEADVISSREETFDISGTVDESNPIFQFYQNKVRKYLNKIRGGNVTEYLDPYGNRWLDVKLTKDDAVNPVPAFSKITYDQFKYLPTSVEEQLANINSIADRLKVEIPTGVVSEIYTGERDLSFEDMKGRARGVQFNNVIFLNKNEVTKTTGVHEVVHDALNNWKLYDVFQGLSRVDIYKAANGGKNYTVEQIGELQEVIAERAEQYFAEKSQSNLPKPLLEFFERLRIVLSRVYNAFGGKTDPIRDFIRVLHFGRSQRKDAITRSFTHLEQQELRDITRIIGNDYVLDFGLLDRMDEIRSQQAGFFEKIKEEADKDVDSKTNKIRKDINFVEKVLAQSRDVFLKDENEFNVADIIEKIGERRRMQKENLDEKISGYLNKYFELKKESRKKVDNVLFKGDAEQTKYSVEELQKKNLNKDEIEAYNAVRDAFDIAHELLLQKMAENGMPAEEIASFRRMKTGYIPHKWKYRFVVKKQKKNAEGYWETESMADYSSKKVAEDVWRKENKANADKGVRYVVDTLDSLAVDFFSEQGLSFEAIKGVINNAKTGEDIKKSMIASVRNMIKEKGFGQQYIQRTGVEGYDREALPSTIADYFSGLNGFLTKLEAGRQYYESLNLIDPRRQKNFYEFSRDLVAYDMGNAVETIFVPIPGTEVRIDIKQVAFAYYLANDLSFLLTNATQNFTVGVGELSKYMKGKDKIIKPEIMIIKAMKDWATKNVTPEERATVEGLLKYGRLGGEMASELMGFKNNPIYKELSGTFSKVMYNSTAIVERDVNRVPTFLAARRLFIEQGYSETEANAKALDVSDDIHFRYGKQNRPEFMRGRKSVFFVFLHYARSLLFQMYRDLSRKEFVSFSRKLGYTMAFGGVTSLPLIGLFKVIFTMIFGVDDDEEAKKEIKFWETLFERGIPAATVGVDLSGRVGVELLTVNNILEDSNDIRGYLGVMGNFIWFSTSGPDKGGRIQKAVELARQGRIADALGQGLPDMFGNVFKAYSGYNYGVRSFAGTPLEDFDGSIYKYNTWEAIVKGAGFTPVKEGVLWDEKAKEWALADQKAVEKATVRRDIQFKVQSGNIEEARELQRQAQIDGIIDQDTDYIREYGKDMFIEDSLKEWESGDKNRTRLEKIENNLIKELYGEEATDTQKNNVRKDFAFVRTFGLNDQLANEVNSAGSNADKISIMLQAEAEMPKEEFKAFFDKGRKEIELESGRKSNILISDQLEESFKEARENPEAFITDDTKPTYTQGEQKSEGSIIKDVMTYAKALGTDPVTAFNRIFTGQKIRRVDSGAIIVERMDLEDSQAVRFERGATNEMRLDHTVPLQLGGSNSEKNLKLVSVDEWESYTPVENYLGALLRDGIIDKKKAQDLITKFKRGEISEEEVYSTN